MRAIRKLTRRLAALVHIIGAVSCTSSSARIDGSSPEAFERTNAEILKSLSSSDQTKRGLQCQALKISVPTPFREELNGKTFEEILQDARAKPMSRTFHVVQGLSAATSAIPGPLVPARSPQGLATAIATLENQISCHRVIFSAPESTLGETGCSVAKFVRASTAFTLTAP